MSDKKKQPELLELNDVIYRNASEDRERAIQLYDDIKSNITNLYEYSENGSNLAKILEYISKPNSQLIDLAKLEQSRKEKEESELSEDEKEKLFDKINKK